MMHKRRTFCVSPVATAEDLAEKLTNYTWTLCTGIRLGGYLFLNDSTCEDGAQEYAVIKETEGGQLLQVESITFGWCDRDSALAYIRRTLAGEFDAGGVPLTARLETPEQHGRCPHCA